MGNKYKVYQDTYHRDTDKDFIYETNRNLWPHITMLDVDNIEDSVQFSKYEDNEYTFINENENTEYIAKKISLYDILVISGTGSNTGSNQGTNILRDEFEIRKNISDILVTDTVIGICVIPSNVIDEYARFITMFDIDDKNYGAYSGRELELPKYIGEFFRNHPQDYGIDEISKGLNYHNSLYFNEVSPSKINTFISLDSHNNVIPIINEEDSTQLNKIMQRPVQYTGAMPSDAITSGKKSSSFDAGLDNYSYYYQVGGDMCNYIPSMWKLNGSKNPSATNYFYYDNDLNAYVSFKNALNDINGFQNNIKITKRILFYDSILEWIEENNIQTIGGFRFSNDSIFASLNIYNSFNGSLNEDENGIMHSNFYTTDNIININFNKDYYEYIPAIGELSFIIPRIASINEIIRMINSYHSQDPEPDLIDLSKIYLSSTEASYDGVYGIFPYNGSIMNVYKHCLCTGRTFVKAFLDSATNKANIVCY